MWVVMVRVGAGGALAMMLADSAEGSVRDGEKSRFCLKSKVLMDWMATITTKTSDCSTSGTAKSMRPRAVFEGRRARYMTGHNSAISVKDRHFLSVA